MPHSAGDLTPAGGGTWRPISLNSRPIKLSGVQFAMPRRPPERSTRIISSRRALLVRREHRAERRQHHVEAGVGKRQFLDVGFLETDVEALGPRALASLFEQRQHIVGRSHAGKAARGGERCVAVAGRDIEYAFVGAHVGGFGQRLADDLQVVPTMA